MATASTMSVPICLHMHLCEGSDGGINKSTLSRSSKTTTNDDGNNRINVITCIGRLRMEAKAAVTTIADVFIGVVKTNMYLLCGIRMHALVVSVVLSTMLVSFVFDPNTVLTSCSTRYPYTFYTQIKSGKERRRERKLDKQNGKK